MILNVDMLRTFRDSLSVPFLEALSALAVTDVSEQPVGPMFRGKFSVSSYGRFGTVCRSYF